MRDIDKLSNMGIPVYTQPGYNGGVFIDNNYKFDKSFFTKKEIEDIILAFYISNHFNKNSNKNSVLKKLELILPELVSLKEFDFEKYLKIELIKNPISFNNQMLKIINNALDKEIFIEIKINEKLYIVAPLYYILRSDDLYIYCSNNKKYFTFPINKIKYCKETNREFSRNNFNVNFNQK